MKIKLLILIFLLTLSSFSQKDTSSIYNAISFFKQPSKDALSIKDIIKNYELGKFQQEETPKLYKYLEKKHFVESFCIATID